MAMDPRRTLFLPALVSAALLLGACSQADPPAATVAGVDITDAEVRTTAGVYQAIFGIQQQPCGQLDGDSDTEEAACNRFALSQLIGLRLAEDYAVDAGISVTDEEVEAEVANLESGLGAEIVAEALATNEVTREDLAALARSFLVEDQVARAIAIEQVGDEGLQAAYEENIGDYTVIDVDHILLQTEEEANEVYELVTAPDAGPEEFAALATERSIDPSAQENAGALGAAPAGGYVPEFSEAALGLEPGEISEPVQSDFGWHVIRLNSSEVTPFEEVRDEIVATQSSDAFVDFVTAKDEAGEIEVNPTFGRFDRETLTVVRVSSTDPSASQSPSEPANAVPTDDE
jgi:parvulin-like peptidyl-prolyl isomerase